MEYENDEIKIILNDIALDDYTNKISSVKNNKFRNNIMVNCSCFTNCKLNNYPKHLLSKTHAKYADCMVEKRYCYKVVPTD
jgi:hypothetical protein